MKSIILLLILFLLNVERNLYSQVNNFEKGYQDGFNKGYCYNQSITCMAPILITIPLPRINEDGNKYTDGYNRGFQMGLDMQRASSSPSNSNNTISYNKTPSTFRSSEYVPPVDLKLLTNVLVYKQKLYDSRFSWIQNKINDLNDLNYSLLYGIDYNSYDNINKQLQNFVNAQLNSKSIDFTDNNLFSQIQSVFKNYQNSIVKAYNVSKAKVSTLIIPLYDMMNTGSNPCKVYIIGKGLNSYNCFIKDLNQNIIPNDLVVFAIQLTNNKVVFAYSKKFNSIYNVLIDNNSFSDIKNVFEMDILGKGPSLRFYGKGITPIIYDKGIKQENLIYQGEEIHPTTNGSSYPFKVFKNNNSGKKFYVLALGYDESLKDPNYLTDLIYSN